MSAQREMFPAAPTQADQVTCAFHDGVAAMRDACVAWFTGLANEKRREAQACRNDGMYFIAAGLDDDAEDFQRHADNCRTLTLLPAAGQEVGNV